MNTATPPFQQDASEKQILWLASINGTIQEVPFSWKCSPFAHHHMISSDAVWFNASQTAV